MPLRLRYIMINIVFVKLSDKGTRILKILNLLLQHSRLLCSSNKRTVLAVGTDRNPRLCYEFGPRITVHTRGSSDQEIDKTRRRDKMRYFEDAAAGAGQDNVASGVKMLIWLLYGDVACEANSSGIGKQFGLLYWAAMLQSVHIDIHWTSVTETCVGLLVNRSVSSLFVKTLDKPGYSGRQIAGSTCFKRALATSSGSFLSTYLSHLVLLRQSSTYLKRTAIIVLNYSIISRYLREKCKDTFEQHLKAFSLTSY